MINIIPEKNQLDDIIGIIVHRDNQELNSFSTIENFIQWLFRFRCIGLDAPCHKRASEINEIEPRSSGQGAMDWRNRVLLCHEHHMQYHAQGTSDDAIQKLKARRIEYLEAIGREEYI